MRKLDKIIIWPVYFDSTKTRKNGRRIPKISTVPLPKILEIKDAAEKLGLKYEIVENVSHPKTPWLKTGVLLVEKKEVKEKTIKRIATQLQKIRSTPMEKS